jgi:alanine racemase
MEPEEIKTALATVRPLPGRMNPLSGIENVMLLDDTHNASPASVMAGLATLDTLARGRRRIAILGDMLHLGEYEQEAHRLIGQMAAFYRIEGLITRGERAAVIAEAALAAGLPQERVVVTSTYEDAAQAARHLLAKVGSDADVDAEDAESAIHLAPTTLSVYEGDADALKLVPTTLSVYEKDTILIKGSEETRMERVTELLMAQPEQAREVLVRQTPGWKQIVMTRAERPTWVEIDLSAVGNNTRRIKDIVGPQVQVLVSLKADAYGHGAIKVARTVLHNGASMLGVATLSEATPLREAGITAPILVFGYVPLWQMREAVRQDVTVTLYSVEAAQALSRAALALNKMVNVHVKIDTGMGRLGVRSEQSEEIMRLVQDIAVLPGLMLEGLYTHFAMADAQDKQHAQLQLSRFESVLHLLTEQGLRPPIVHAANSAAMLNLAESHYDIVRPGIAIYGLDPSIDVRLPEGFRPALSFKTLVAQVKLVPAGECVSYGCAYTTERPTLVATLPVGYADGFRRAPKNWGSVLIHGQEAPILGRVCMDQCMVDVTHIPQVRMGDEVVLIGRQGNVTLTAEQVAERLGTINYEVVSEILARVPRVD